FTKHSVITIDDLDRFVNDPQHTGRLDATVDYTPFGQNLKTSNGVFNLFTPPDSRGYKHMVYDFQLEHLGVKYFFHGQKNIRNDKGGLDLWHDTTTLYSTLHRGDDQSGAIVGAGILSLGITDLVKIVSSMKATGASSAADSLAAVSKFGHFFMG